MKLRWREHEIIFVTILAVAEMILSLSNYRLSFIYWRNVLIPQTASVLLMYLAYLAVNLLIIPSIKKISFNDIEKLITLTIIKPISLVIGVCYLLAIGVNIISWYAQPHVVNYAGYQLLAMLGYNDKPLTDLFFGFGRAIWMVILFAGLAGIRELVIWLINRPHPSREFRVLVVNNVTPLLFIFFLVSFFTNPIHRRFMDYIAWTIPVLAIYIYYTFWLFPFSEKYTWRHPAVLFRLLASAFAAALFSAVVFSGGHKLLGLSMFWLFQLAIITPLTWLLYQQRKDKILQLKGLETALAKTTTDLQFLRSQINPHFLFNALNTLYGAALKERSEQTAAGIQMLGDMMRFMLHENNLDFIAMNKEIEYLKNYIALQKIRTPPSPDIQIEDNIGDIQCNCRIAPMLLIPFVENAFKHGISLNERSWIDMKLDCAETSVCFEVRNSIHSRYEGDTEKNRSGIGLKNVAERLKLLYPNKHTLKVSENENEFTAKMVIQLN